MNLLRLYNKFQFIHHFSSSFVSASYRHHIYWCVCCLSFIFLVFLFLVTLLPLVIYFYRITSPNTFGRTKPVCIMFFWQKPTRPNPNWSMHFFHLCKRKTKIIISFLFCFKPNSIYLKLNCIRKFALISHNISISIWRKVGVHFESWCLVWSNKEESTYRRKNWQWNFFC